MKKEVKALVGHRMGRAKESYEDGVTLLAEGRLHSAVNRFYYAAFYATRALLATKGLDSSKHSGVISLFHQYFVKPGTFSPEISKILTASFERRQDSDYEDFVEVSRPEVEAMQESVRQFIEECKRVLSTI
jgi:uncharacterized protein (UPF0332 family)